MQGNACNKHTDNNTSQQEALLPQRDRATHVALLVN